MYNIYKLVVVFLILFVSANVQAENVSRIPTPKKEVVTHNYICNKTNKPHVYKCIDINNGKEATCSVNDRLGFDCK